MINNTIVSYGEVILSNLVNSYVYISSEFVAFFSVKLKYLTTN